MLLYRYYCLESNILFRMPTVHHCHFCCHHHHHHHHHHRGGEWYLEKRGSRKILAGSQNLGSVFSKSRSLVFSWFASTLFESRNFSPKSLGLGFLTRISASQRVSDFTIRHPSSSSSSLLWLAASFFMVFTWSMPGGYMLSLYCWLSRKGVNL